VHGGGDGYEALGRWLVELRGEQTQKALARKLGVSVATVCRAEKGVDFSVRTAAAYDAHYGAAGVVPKGEILARRYGADEARRLAEAEAVTAACRGGGSGVSPADRRGLLYVVGVPVMAEALGRAEQASRAITASRPDPWTLTELTEDSVAIAARYWSTPLDELLPVVLDRWKQCDDMLNRSLIGKTCEQVIRLAGHFAYYVARIGFHTGDRRLASGFGTLASQYAEASGDPLLIGSVACLRVGVAFESDRFAEAADVAGQAVGQAHPYTKARLCAYQSRAFAAGGYTDKARDALADMRRYMVDLPPMAGAALFDEGEQVLYSAMTLADIGDRDAELLARDVIANIPDDQYIDHGFAWTAIGKALAGSDPGAAADAGLRAVEMNRAWPSTPIESRVRRLHRALARDHRDVAEVVQLGEAVATLRRPAAKV
jgi:hypothetical protein